MAVYTPVTHEQLSDFLSFYDIGTLVSYEGIEAGVSNTNYFVTTDKARYVLTLFEPHRVRAEDIPFFLNYAITLEQSGVPCPRTMERKDGQTLTYLNDRPAAIFSVLDGDVGSVAALTPGFCECGGKTLARMHIAAEKISKTAPNHFGPARWGNWISTYGHSMDKIAPGLHALVMEEFSSHQWPAHLPMGAIHADYFPDNVFFKGSDVSGVIDFHFVCTDLFVYDLAIALNAWSFDGANNFMPERMESFLNGYNAVRPLSKQEEESLPMLLRAAALRFLLSRIEEKLNWKEGDFMKPHDPLVFEKRLRHFQRASA